MSDTTLDVVSSYGSNSLSSDISSSTDLNSASALAFKQAWSDAGLGMGENGAAPISTDVVNDVQLRPIAEKEFPTPQQAATDAIDAINPISIQRIVEYTGKVKFDPFTGMYYADPPIPGDVTKAQL